MPSITNIPIKKILSSALCHGYHTFRDAAIPGNPYSGFNICHYTGDDTAHIHECRLKLAMAFGMDYDRIIVPVQTHSCNVAVIDRIPFGGSSLDNTDALITSLPDIIIGVNTADCVPVLMADDNSGIIAAVHAGWRGAIGGIVEKTLGIMINKGAKTENTHVAFGPSICCDCFEVGEEVAALFPEICVERHSEWPKPHVNLHRFITYRLTEAGIPEENISAFDNRSCSRCHPDLYFSARASGIASGRIFSFITMYSSGASCII